MDRPVEAARRKTAFMSMQQFAEAETAPARPNRNLPIQKPIKPGKSERDIRIDFFRGFALLAIFVDHVPNSAMMLLTPHAIAFADAAEIFFFLSGFVAARAYGATLRKAGFLAATSRIWHRAWVLYAAQIILLFLFVTEVSLGVSRTGQLSYHALFRSSDFLTQTDTAMAQALMLRFQPVYLDILPCYILFLLAFPAVLVALSRNALLALIPSGALYLGVQLFGWNLTTFPRDEGWFFNPLAWQFLFVVGATLGAGNGARIRRWLFSPWLVVPAAALALPIAVYQEAAMLHTLWPSIPAPSALALPMDKITLSPLRLVSFFALAIMAYHLLPRGAAFTRSRFTASIACCGRHSLHVFCLGILLAVFGYVALEQRGVTPGNEFLVAAGGSAVLIAFARILDWLRGITDRVAPKLTPAPLAGKAR
jgi:hypothetical protein